MRFEYLSDAKKQIQQVDTPMNSIFKTPLFLLAALAFISSFSGHGQAQGLDEAQRERLVSIRLLPEYGRIKAGQEIWMGTEQSITKHWHTYWKNPGDSGTPTKITWDLPTGFTIGEIEWPTPKKLPYGPLLNYGYEGNVMLLQKLAAPEALPESPITLKATIELLVCKEECIPEYGDFEITLNGENAELEDNSAYINAAASKLPTKTDWSVSYAENDGNLILILPNMNDIDVNSLRFFPLDWGIVNNTAAPKTMLSSDGLTLTQARGDRALSDIKTLSGVLAYEDVNGKTHSGAFTAQPAKAMPASVKQTQSAHDTQNTGLGKALILALLGGLILNLMPCVFPVLSMKALSLVKTADKNHAHVRLQGLAYTAGVMLSFLAIAGGLIALKAAGAQIGWGFQLQSPIVVGVLTYLLFLLGLNLMGFFEFANPFANTGSELARKDGISGSFFTGVLATLVATPCTAPFMATALGYALVQPAAISLMVFAALGFGLALPYLLLSFIPAFQKLMPRPGVWMERFKQALAFPMFAAAIWLVWVISQQSGSLGVLVLLMSGLLITLSIWLYQHRPAQKQLRLALTALSIIAALSALGSLTILKTVNIEDVINIEESNFGEEFTQDKLDHLLTESENPIFVEMTAAWCITCKVNHASSINIDSTKALFKEKRVHYLIGDWTNQNPAITKYLDRYGRSGVPIYVYYAPPINGVRPEAIVLPQILTPKIIKDTVTN